MTGSRLLLVRTILLLGCGLGLMAQSDSPKPQSPQPDPQQAEPPPSDSQQADSSAADSGQEYSGPAILSRGQTPSLQGMVPVAFRPYIGVSGTYNTGLLPVEVTSTGHIPSSDAYGEEIDLGAYIYRVFKGTTLALDLGGYLRHYTNSYSEGANQFLSLSLTHEITKRVMFTLRTQAGLYTLNDYSLSAPLGGLDSNYLPLPQDQIFDNRVIFTSASGDLTYLLSPVLSFSVGANGSLVRRESSALYGSTGAGAHGDLQYRISRHTTIGADYSYMYFGYTRGFGNSDIHSVGISYSAQISPHLQLSANIGGTRVESTSLADITLDPAVAAILGESEAIQAAYHLNYVPAIQAQLANTFRRSQFTLSYNNRVTPGNGVYTISRNNTGGAYYSYSGVHYWNFGASASYGRMSSLAQTLGAYTSYGGGAGVTRELGKGLHAVVRLDARHNDIASGALYRRTQYSASLGVTFSPGDVPLRLW